MPALRQALLHAKGSNDPEAAGDYYEFGVFRGYSFLMAQRISRELGLAGTQFWGFDSFAGLPELGQEDVGEGQFFAGQFACPREVVERHLTANGFDWSRAALIEGFYNESLTSELRRSFPFRRASVVLLDCDLYTSTRDALNWVAPYLADGTILLFDDWYSYGRAGNEGQPRALREFLELEERLVAEPFNEFGDNGKGFVLRKNGGTVQSS